MGLLLEPLGWRGSLWVSFKKIVNLEPGTHPFLKMMGPAGSRADPSSPDITD